MATAKKTGKKFKPGVSGKRALRVPITNVNAGGDYSAKVLIGSEKIPVNVLLDTGSSTFAVSPRGYDPAKDKFVKPTAYAQVVEYGTGGWAGPLVNTTITINGEDDKVSLQRLHVAITIVEEKDNFVGIHGILGLAFNGLNAAYDLADFLAKKKARFSHPWPFKSKGFSAFNEKFQQLRASDDIPEKEVEPYFTELEEQGVVANKFAFYALRSRTHHGSKDKSKSASDPMNRGLFIMGGGEEQTDLYTGGENAFLTAEVYHHRYYNVHLVSVQVEGCEAANVRPLQKKYLKESISNAIVDSGTNYLPMANDVYRYIIKSLKKINPSFIELIKESDVQKMGLDARKLDLSQWPDIHFTFSGENRKNIRLTCTPDTYWQINAPDHGHAVFMIEPGDGQNQSVFGLPLFNNYYTVFDRSVHQHGVVRFAPIKRAK